MIELEPGLAGAEDTNGKRTGETPAVSGLYKLDNAEVTLTPCLLQSPHLHSNRPYGEPAASLRWTCED